MHFEYIAQATASGIMQVSLESYVPVIFGVLTVLNKEQAIKRSVGTGNEGLSWGKSAVEMGLARMSALGLDKQSTKDEAKSKSGDPFARKPQQQQQEDSDDDSKKNTTSTPKKSNWGF
jgi:hypothetical protein